MPFFKQLIVVEIESGHHYAVKRVLLRERDPASPNYGKRVYILSRSFDHFQRRESAAALEQSFRLLEPHDDGGTRSVPKINVKQVEEVGADVLYSQSTTQFGTLIEPNFSDDFSQLVLSNSVIRGIHLALDRIRLQGFLNNEWGLSKVMGSTAARSTILFSGSPGVPAPLRDCWVRNYWSRTFLR